MPPSTFTSDDMGLDGVVDALARDGMEVGPAAPMRRTVLDTFDGRIHAAGLRLELQEGGRRELALFGAGPVVARVAVDRPPVVAADLPAGPVHARLAPALDVRSLAPVLSIAGRERRAVRRDGAAKVRCAVVVYGDLALSTGPMATPRAVAEVEPLLGYDAEGQAARKLLRDLGLAPRPDDLLDLVAAVTGTDLRGFVSSPTVALDPAQPAVEAYRAVLANLARTMDANRPGTVGHVDPEFLHDYRIAIRRTRSVLGEAKGVIPADTRARFREAFKWLGTATSPSRDLDVYVLEWAGYVEPLGPEAATSLGPLVAHIARLRDEEHATLSATLASPRHDELVQEWAAWLAGPDMEDATAPRARRAVGAVVRRRVEAAQDVLLTGGRSIGPQSPAEDLHELRKDAKRLRYLVECFGSLFPPAPRKSFVQRLKALQDNLGEHQDTEVHASKLRELSAALYADPATTPDALLAMGRLAERFEQRRGAARAEFGRRFADYDTAATAKALRAMLPPAAPA